MPERVYNFSAGPATLPESVLQEVSQGICNFQDKGMGLIEMSHRSPEFMELIEEAEALVRKLLSVPEGYSVLFLQGGASSQFFMVPMNLLGPGQKASYLNTGTWSNKAIAEARHFGEILVPYSSKDNGFRTVPQPGEYSVDPQSTYLYFVSNNTVYGTQYDKMPETDIPLVADMSSDILARPIDVSKFGLIFAGAQKNIGPAGATLVIIKDEWLDRVPDTVPTMLRYATHAAKGSLFNTPPTFAIYCVAKVLGWLDDLGGVEAMEKINRAKASLLYEAIDNSDFYQGYVDPASRSTMNVTFHLPTPELDAQFVSEANAQGMSGLKGYRLLGGVRASIYNAMPLEGVEKLVRFMGDFQGKYSK